MKHGDLFTMAGVYRVEPRKWWQFWRPRFVPTNELQVFRALGGPTGGEIGECSIPDGERSR